MSANRALSTTDRFLVASGPRSVGVLRADVGFMLAWWQAGRSTSKTFRPWLVESGHSLRRRIEEQSGAPYHSGLRTFQWVYREGQRLSPPQWKYTAILNLSGLR